MPDMKRRGDGHHAVQWFMRGKVQHECPAERQSNRKDIITARRQLVVGRDHGGVPVPPSRRRTLRVMSGMTSQGRAAYRVLKSIVEKIAEAPHFKRCASKAMDE